MKRRVHAFRGLLLVCSCTIALLSSKLLSEKDFSGHNLCCHQWNSHTTNKKRVLASCPSSGETETVQRVGAVPRIVRHEVTGATKFRRVARARRIAQRLVHKFRCSAASVILNGAWICLNTWSRCDGDILNVTTDYTYLC
jgi:hypothetical protein